MKSKDLYIFGNGDIAQVAYYYFSNFTNYKIVNFVVDDEYLKEKNFCETELINTSNFLKINKDNLKIFIALGYSKLNTIRENKYLFFKKKGYEFASYISSQAIILNDNKIGENCFILENNVIQPYSEIKNNVIIWSGNHIGHHSIIDNNVFMSSHVVVSGRVKIEKNTFIGVNSTIRDNIIIGNHSIIGAGSLILKKVDSYSIYKNSSTIKSQVRSDKLK